MAPTEEVDKTAPPTALFTAQGSITLLSKTDKAYGRAVAGVRQVGVVISRAGWQRLAHRHFENELSQVIQTTHQTGTAREVHRHTALAQHLRRYIVSYLQKNGGQAVAYNLIQQTARYGNLMPQIAAIIGGRGILNIAEGVALRTFKHLCSFGTHLLAALLYDVFINGFTTHGYAATGDNVTIAVTDKV